MLGNNREQITEMFWHSWETLNWDLPSVTKFDYGPDSQKNHGSILGWGDRLTSPKPAGLLWGPLSPRALSYIQSSGEE